MEPMHASLAMPLAVLITTSVALTGCSAFSSDFEHEDPTGVPSSYTEAGAVLELDEAALIANDEPSVDIAISIREAKELDKSFYDELSNGEDFEQYTPYVVVVQYDTLDEFDKDSRPSFKGLGGILESGELAGALVNDSSGLASAQSVCPYSLSSTNGGDGTWRLDCIIFLVPEGDSLSSLAYYGYSPYSTIGLIARGAEGFDENPILWKL
jgi:hypothetical protein